MKNLLIVFIILLCISCTEKSAIIGTWERTGSYGTYSLTFKEDNTFEENCDHIAMDPNYWYGTYSENGSTLTMVVKEHFMGTTTTESFSIDVSKNKLSMTKNEDYTKVYSRVDLILSTP